MKKNRQNAGLWWTSVVALAFGTVIYILLQPDFPDHNRENIRTSVLFATLIIPGLCLIIGTRRRWFGKDL